MPEIIFNGKWKVYLSAFLSPTEFDYRRILFAANTGVVDGDRKGAKLELRIPMPTM